MPIEGSRGLVIFLVQTQQGTIIETIYYRPYELEQGSELPINSVLAFVTLMLTIYRNPLTAGGGYILWARILGKLNYFLETIPGSDRRETRGFRT